MSDVRLTVHRATHQIGGNCIEITAGQGARIILDVGRPLDAPAGATGLLPGSLDVTAPVDGVLISHPHQDHYGLLEEIPAHWPVYCGAPTAALIKLTTGIFGAPLARDFRPWASGEPLQIGPFRITPYLTDHSAFDAHMLLIEVAGKRILYSGDFRNHGRKSSLVAKMMASPPANLDVLLMEGTNLGSDKPCITETQIEADFEALFKATQGCVYVAWSAQNIDRTVSLYRACLKTGRTLVVDLYTADVLEVLASFAKLPQPGWPAMKVVITKAFARMYRKTGRGEFVQRMAACGLSARSLTKQPGKWVVMVRPSLIRDYEPAGLMPSAQDAWSWSMWRGYLDNDDGIMVQAWFDAAGAQASHIHTSGHAATSELKAFAHAMKPRWLVPIHGVAWDNAAEGFPPIRRLADGEPLTI